MRAAKPGEKPGAWIATLIAIAGFFSGAPAVAAGGAQINPDGSVSWLRGGHWEVTPLRPPPSTSGLTYTSAQVDSAGNLYVTLGGSGEGFNFLGKSGRPLIVAHRIQWTDTQNGKSTVVEGIRALIARPDAPGAWILDRQGRVLEITPPAEKMGAFGMRALAVGGAARAISAGPQGLIVERLDGSRVAWSGESAKPIREDRRSADVLRSQEPAPTLAPAPAAARQRAVDTSAIDQDAFARELWQRRHRVTEFEFIRAEAEKLGVRAWLFGGAAAAFGHYTRWDLAREGGDSRYLSARFGYALSDIYRSTQDLDIVIDGTSAQADALARELKERFDYRQGPKSAWEVRTLRSAHGPKDALLENPDYLRQHNDSNSTGLIELTEPPAGEPLVRDLADWGSREPEFLADIREGRLRYRFSDLHGTTRRAIDGLNPPILSVIRLLTKAFQYDLELRPEDLKAAAAIAREFDPSSIKAHGYVANWIEAMGKKLVQNSLDPERSWSVLDQLGLRTKLISVAGGDPGKLGTLAWWLSREPLRSHPVGIDPRTHRAASGRTAAEIFAAHGLPLRNGQAWVTHETQSIEAHENITFSPDGRPVAFISRGDGVGELAIKGDGFYAAAGAEQARGTGYPIRMVVDPRAREGVDFKVVAGGRWWIFSNREALRVIPDDLHLSLASHLRAVANDDKLESSEKALLNKVRRRLFLQQTGLTPEALEEGAAFVLTELHDHRRAARVLGEWSRVPERLRAPLDAGIRQAALRDGKLDFLLASDPPLLQESPETRALKARRRELASELADADWGTAREVFAREARKAGSQERKWRFLLDALSETVGGPERERPVALFGMPDGGLIASVAELLPEGLSLTEDDRSVFTFPTRARVALATETASTAAHYRRPDEVPAERVRNRQLLHALRTAGCRDGFAALKNARK